MVYVFFFGIFLGYAHFDIVKLLIERGANVNYYTESTSTPLRAACYIGKIDIVKFLINHGANVNTVNESNSTCLMIASQRGVYIYIFHKFVICYL